LGPYWDANQIYNQFPPDYITTIFNSGVRDQLTQEDLVASSSMYRTVAVSYARFLSRHALDTPNELPALYLNTMNSLKGKTRNYVLFYLLKENIDKGVSEVGELYRNFRKDCSYTPYLNYIDSLSARFETLSLNQTLLDATLESNDGEKISWQKILNINKGKVVYIDLWASWCRPCIAEMSESKKLRKSIADKDISFVYISIDLDREKWINSIETNGLKEGSPQHYLLNPKSGLAKFFNAPPIPRYILINKQGRAISLDAKRPSHPNLLSEINKLL
jgi:thiol-disulfide isomerase/thioredoxin